MATHDSARQHLEILTDFDGTTFLTGETPIDGVDVNGAYALAINEALGAEMREQFTTAGGHNHRTPLEIVTDLRPASTQSENAVVAEQVTHDKLDILVGQIGTPLESGELWPRPTPGYVNFWNSVFVSKERGRRIATGIISAGHGMFITKCYDLYDLPQPETIVCEEVLNREAAHLPVSDRSKPSPLLIHIARKALSNIPNSDYVGTAYLSIYAGDDPIKDGGLADNYGADYFALIAKGQEASAWQHAARRAVIPLIARDKV